MKKRFLVSFILALCVIFSFSFCFAADNGLEKAANDVRNFVGGVEDTVENAAKDVSNTSKDITGGIENGVDGNRNNNARSTMGVTDNNGGYTTTRVNADDNTVLGMSSTAWTWLIIGIAAIAIVAVVWYYSMQFTNTNTHHDDE